MYHICAIYSIQDMLCLHVLEIIYFQKCFADSSILLLHLNWRSYFINADMNNIWKNLSLRALSMATTQGDIASPSGVIDEEDDPEHLLVLVHGIMGR